MLARVGGAAVPAIRHKYQRGRRTAGLGSQRVAVGGAPCSVVDPLDKYSKGGVPNYGVS